ncbi:MAG: hypothetical protein AUJ07_01605 [Crenarchaeota archaeon 13_1_40CM_3_53_5]|nr:MAG: hypothetical protein AUJ07_01605 [Crenarchaeota archaeon 13_1_40CM_3_53_5]
MKILILNFRDLGHPEAGGAEVFTEEVGKRLVEYGHEVTLFASSFGHDGANEASRHGMRIMRDGGKYRVYSKARSYVKHHGSEFDVIIDEINTIPFNSHRASKSTPVIALIHQLARKIWFYEAWFPLSLLGYSVLEPVWLRCYKNVPTITISASTRNDLVRLGFKQVSIVHAGISTTPLPEVPAKDMSPILIFFGRLVKSKGPHHAVSAFKRVQSVFPSAKLWIVGDGYMKRKIVRDNVEGVIFFGKLAQKEKFDLLKKAHILLAPSVREGWGISVMEANSMGTPAIGYDVPGLQDSIINEFTGLRVPANPSALGNAVLRVLQDPSLARYLAANALEWSKEFSWDRTAKEFNSILESSIKN